MSSKKSLKILIAALILVISSFHYTTPTSYRPLHELYKVLYFIPIILGAFGFGLKGGMMTALIVTFLYLPHVVFQWGGNIVMNISRFFMIFLYNTLGGLTGYLWEQERKQKTFYQQASERLKESIDKLKKTTDELALIENQLRMAERLSTLGELTASLAHEVRNPLGSIRGVAEILRDESRDKSHKKFVGILLKETQRLDAVVANYLTFARPRTEEREVMSLKKTIESTLALLGPELRKKTLQLDVDVEPQDLTMFCREGQIRQALVNIFLNAIQASPANSTISISAKQNEKALSITVSDQGPGIGEEARKHLFEPFYTEKPDGTGLGLAITKRIVESHNGTIYAKNSESGGAQIKMEFLKNDQDRQNSPH
ncbi:MAG: sensor histidine kinase [Calditrichaeota bacterium]|nr:sensor histidine kinase [Calditrichota bacterium]